MATVTAGTNETANATTIEGKLFQITHLINSAEKGLAVQRLNITKSDDLILEGDFTIPGIVTYTPSTGIFTVAAAPYLPTLPFTSGSPVGTIKAGTLSQYFIDVLSYIVHWQNQPAKNPNRVLASVVKFAGASP